MTQPCRNRDPGKALVAMMTLAALAGCSDSATEPAGGGGGGAGTGSSLFDVAVETRYIDVYGSCDADDILGNPNPGEFQYSITISGPGRSHMHGTRDFDTVTGEHVSAYAGDRINFPNVRLTFTNLTESVDNYVRVTMAMTEWDGLSRDSGMDGSNIYRGDPLVGGLDMTPGSGTGGVVIRPRSNCWVEMVYDWEIRPS